MKVIINKNAISFPASFRVSHQGLIITIFFASFSLGLTSTTFGQLKRFPLPRNTSTSLTKSKTEAARTKGVSLSLPFWDDFSFTPVNDTSNSESNVPLISFWEKGRRVWVNDGIGINPPTIHVATFDGLDAAGLPYSDQVLANGFRDTLQSQPINLAEVVGADTTTVFLSFFYQWQGNGEPPDPSDYMRIEFKNDSSVWEKVMDITTRPTLDKTIFYDTIVQVSGKHFFHDTFQFRFKNYGRQSGPYDTWNIDYVYLNKGRTINDNSFPDRAVASAISPLFGKYQAIPAKHFFAEKVIDSVTFDVKNLKNNLDLISVGYSVDAQFTNYLDSVPTTYSKTLVFNAKVGELAGLMLPRQRVNVQVEQLPDPDDVLQFDPASDSIEVKLTAEVISGDELDANKVAFIPFDLRINDTISTHYYLRRYYAYDDGSAEYSAGLTRAGNKLAYQFTRPTGIVDSLAVLNGFDVYFPDFGIVPGQTVDFVVYGDNGGMPGEVLYTVPSYRIERRGANNFQFIRIGEPFFVGTTYYIGWKAPVSGAVVVGLDDSNNSGSKMIVYTNGKWAVNDAVEGSLMLRPYFGKAQIVVGVETAEDDLQIFPNPSKGDFYVKGKYDRLEIITVTGQSISYTSERQDKDTRVSIVNPSSGLYILKIVKGNRLQTKKIVVE